MSIRDRLFKKSDNEDNTQENQNTTITNNDNTIKRPFPAYEGDENYIFISYAHKDRNLVFPEIKRFHDEGFPIWYDEGLTPGQEWDEEIAISLMNSSLLVVFISQNSMASKNVHDEIKLALSKDIDIVPIYLEDTTLPPAFELRLSTKHSIFKHALRDSDYTRDCFKAFSKSKIPKIKFEEDIPETKTEAEITESDFKPDKQLTSNYLKEFEELNTTTKSIYDLKDYKVLIILKDGTNLTDWDDVKNKEDIIYVSEDLSDYTDLTDKYEDLKSLKAVVPLKVTNKVKSMERMFNGCSTLEDISALSGWDTSQVNNMTWMFDGCSSLKDIAALSSWDTSQVTQMTGMFNDCSSLEDISALSNWDTSLVNNMRWMFYGCSSLKDISALSNWDTSLVNNMRWMFYGCSSLKDISALSSWDTAQVSYMERMFEGCSSLEDISALSGWDTAQVIQLSGMFRGCANLKDISAISDWDTAKATEMNGMFEGCRYIKNYPSWYE